MIMFDVKRQSDKETELRLSQLGIHVERAAQILGVVLNLLLSACFRCVGVKNPSSSRIDGTDL